MSGPFKMRGFSGFGNSPLEQSIPVEKGESYKSYLNRAAKKTTDPYFKDVGDKRWHASQTKQHKADAKKKTRLTYKGVKKNVSKYAKKLGASDKTIEKASRIFTKGKQFFKRIPKAGPAAAAITATTLVLPTIKKTAKATVEGLKERAKSGNVNIGRKL